jgi:hypothetical protein
MVVRAKPLRSCKPMAPPPLASLGTRQFADANIFGEFGVVRLRRLAMRRTPWASR